MKRNTASRENPAACARGPLVARAAQMAVVAGPGLR
ncbi:MAG: hypothetical protein FD161_3707 [Limisphaerales bacterium]|nr:MAG: hypothetical protein FD161_3707 [Limisphaerales bacterium]KAG0507513.1 MAG: hypothetical protein E1N63_3304 [Limisphaerales bacterium]TXT48987.1 MAG: hypothetical protein FD140_3369 [Limisphaerales bacterium]